MTLTQSRTYHGITSQILIFIIIAHCAHSANNKPDQFKGKTMRAFIKPHVLTGAGNSLG